MAPSTAAVAQPSQKSLKPKEAPSKEVAKEPSNTPYQLDQAQVLKASHALLKFVASQKGKDGKPNLLVDADEPSDTAESIWLNLTTKKFISDAKKLKPSRVALPHPLRTTTNTTACLIVKDPQRPFKDLVTATTLTATITKVIGISKLRSKFKTFESRRLLCGSHDLFLADDRIILALPKLLGKPFYSRSAKVPIPVSFDGRNGVSANRLKAELGKALDSTYVHLSPSASTSIRVGLSSFTPEMLAENIAVVVQALTEKKVPGGWRGVKSVHIKSPNSAALPIWMTEELYAEEDVLRPEVEAAKKEREEKKKEKRKVKKVAKLKERKAYNKARAALFKEDPAAAAAKSEEDGEEKLEVLPAVVSKAQAKSEETLVQTEVVAKKKRKSLGDSVDAGLDVTVKQAKKLKTKKASA